jgi:hypothetical protein
MTRAAKIGWLLAALAGAAPAARADWIVTRDGGKLETKGSWQVKGKMVVFSLPNGTLSSLRSDKVDFAASQRATEQARKEAVEGPAAAADKQREAAAKSRRPSVRILTDKDFKKTPAEAAPAAESPDGKQSKEKEKAKEPAAKDTVPAPAGSLQVLSWDRVNPASPGATPGVQLTGKVRNAGGDQLTELTVTAILFDESGNPVARVPAALAVSHLAAGETTTFTVDAPTVSGFAAVKFDAQGRGFKIHTQPAAKGAAAPPATGETARPDSPPPG